MAICYGTVDSNGFISTSRFQIEWTTVIEVGKSGEWWEGVTNPSRMTIPTGVTEVEIFWWNYGDHSFLSTSADFFMDLYKNGSEYIGNVIFNPRFASGAWSSGLISVTPGDYFEFSVQRSGGGSGGINGVENYCGMAILEPKNRKGISLFALDGDKLLTSSYQQLDWTATSDTLSTISGGNSFVVPVGVNFALITPNARLTATDNSLMSLELRVNGTSTWRKSFVDDLWFHPGSGFVQPVESGDTLTLWAYKDGGTLDADYTHVMVEWIQVAQ